ASSADKERKALGVERIVGQELELLAFHFAGCPATYAPHFKLEVYARVAARKVAHATDNSVVPAVMQASTTTAARFFERRLSLMMRAFGSPKMPRTVASGRNPGNAYASHKRLFRALQADIRNPRQVSNTPAQDGNPAMMGVSYVLTPKSTHTTLSKTREYKGLSGTLTLFKRNVDLGRRFRQ